MKILAIDTTGQQAGAAIMDEYITIGEIMINAQSGPKSWHHSEILMPAIDRMFYLSGQEISDIDYVAYTAGPGSFTGIRIGAATALGLARSIDKPAVAVPTLDALAYNMLGMHDCIVVPLMDARRGQVYTAIYHANEIGQLTKISDYFAAPIGEAIEKAMHFCGTFKTRNTCQSCNKKEALTAQALFLGDGADAYKRDIIAACPSAKFAPPNSNRQRPASVGLCAMYKLAAGTATTNPELIYIRDPQAVRAKHS